MKVMIVVTHLLGSGHLSRAVTLARAFSNAGHQVSVLSGGRAAPHLNLIGLSLVQLPPLASDGTDFSRLLDDVGEVTGPQYLAQRLAQIVETLQDIQPDVLITELFPFGRRSLSAEFLGLLDAAQSLKTNPLVLASIRDILAPPSKPAKAVRAEAILTDYYHGVLVHSDPGIIRLEESWPVTDRVSNMLHYTGFVAPEPAEAHLSETAHGDVLVSAGGGSVGDDLFECAVAASKLSAQSWRLLVGGADRQQRIEALQHQAGGSDIVIEPVRPDFRQLLTSAAASVSMCGYNTAMDLLQTGRPAVLVPFDDGGEVEQTLRSRALARLPAIEVIATADLSPDILAAAVTRVCATGPRRPAGLEMRGAETSVGLAETMLKDHRA